MSGSPLVSIGLPVYNGAETLPFALDSLLRQDYPHIEIVISDNASTDDTASICREYAGRDPRVSYHRAERNMGAVWNFNRVFGLSRGAYFLWAAADDTRAPSYVRACVGCLERDPAAVLCYSRTSVLTPTANIDDVMANIDLTRRSTCDRLAVMMRSEWWKWGLTFYGLMRAEALRRTRLCENRYAFDFDIVLQLCLQGRFARCDDTVFYYRKMRTGEDDRAAYKRIMTTLCPDNRPKDPPPPWLHGWIMISHVLTLAVSSPTSAGMRARLAGTVLRYGFLTRSRALELRYLIATMTGLRFIRNHLRGLPRRGQA